LGLTFIEFSAVLFINLFFDLLRWSVDSSLTDAPVYSFSPSGMCFVPLHADISTITTIRRHIFRIEPVIVMDLR
jgi:hypothetical protein